MKCLAVDTSQRGLIAIIIDGNKEYTFYQADILKHNSRVLPVIDELLMKSGLSLQDMEYFAAIEGPGSFTGVRIGVTMMNAFNDITKAKLIGVSAFEILNSSGRDTLALIDARSGYYYGAEFKDGRIVREGEYREADIKLIDLEKVYREERDYSSELIEVVRKKAVSGQVSDMLRPHYLKGSQAEREHIKRNYIIAPMRNSHINEVMELDKLRSPWDYNMYSLSIADNNYVSRVLLCNNKVIGYYILLQLLDEMHIMKIAISSSMRRQGYGDILLEHIILTSRERLLKQLTLEVRVSNVQAINLYLKHGFRLTGRRPKYYEMKEDALIYTLEL